MQIVLLLSFFCQLRLFDASTQQLGFGYTESACDDLDDAIFRRATPSREHEASELN
jgi:hypothetical protein